MIRYAEIDEAASVALGVVGHVAYSSLKYSVILDAAWKTSNQPQSIQLAIGRKREPLTAGGVVSAVLYRIHALTAGANAYLFPCFVNTAAVTSSLRNKVILTPGQQFGIAFQANAAAATVGFLRVYVIQCDTEAELLEYLRGAC